MQKISKDIDDMNSTINQLDLIGISRIFQPQQNIHLSQAHMKHSPRQTTFGTLKYTLTTLKE